METNFPTAVLNLVFDLPINPFINAVTSNGVEKQMYSSI